MSPTAPVAYEPKTNLFEEEPEHKPLPVWRKYLGTFRPAYFLDHLDYDSFKVVCCTFVQVWVTVILLVVPRTSHWFGNAAYLMQILGFIVTAGGFPVFLNLYISVLCFVYFLVAWLMTVVALAITSHLRGWPSTEQLVADLILEGVCTEDNASQCFLDEMFSGRYLTTRCTAVWIFTLLIGMVMFGMTEKVHRLFRLAFVTATITLIINTCYGVMMPMFAPMLVGQTILRPMAITFVVKTVCGCLVFPFTANYRFFKGSLAILKGLRLVHANNTRFLKCMKPLEDTFANSAAFSTAIFELRTKFPSLDLFASGAKFEVAVSRFDAGDTGQFRHHVKDLLSTTAGFKYFYDMFLERKDIAQNHFHGLRRKSTTISDGHSKLLTTLHESYREVGAYETNARKAVLERNFGAHSVTVGDLDRMAQLIREEFSSLLDATTHVFDAVIDWVDAANAFRTYQYFSRSHGTTQKHHHDNIVAARAQLLAELDAFTDSGARRQRLEAAVSLEDTLLMYISQLTLLLHMARRQCQQLLLIIDLFLDVDERRPRPRVITWWTKATHMAAQSFQPSIEACDDDPAQFSDKVLVAHINRRDPDAMPPLSWPQVIGRTFVRAYSKVLGNHRFWFWVRVGGLVNICALPYYCRTTAGWYFSNRLIWLPIICGVSTSQYTAETVYNFICKLAYTFLGCLLGVVAWYVSAGSGRGNYYGYAVVTAILYFYLCYYRHFAQHMTTVPSVMIAVTPSLVLGTSWVDGHGNTVANIGYGIRVGFLRFMSVLVGLCVAFLASTFPKPHSSKTAVRRTIANVLDEIGSIHCTVSTFAIQRLNNPAKHALQRHDPMVDKFRNTLLSLAKVRQLVGPIAYEIPLSGVWPLKKYQHFQLVLNDIIQLYYFIFAIVDQLERPEEWMPTLINRAGWYDLELTADIFSMVHMMSASLRLKDPLPKVTRANISIKHLDVVREQWGINKTSLSERFYEDTHENMLRQLDYRKLFSHDGQSNIVILLLCHMAYKRIDEAMIVTKGLVGEKYDFSEELLSY